MNGLALIATLWGCVQSQALQVDHAQLAQLLQQARAQGAVDCTPFELAVAEANEEFARIEFREGDARRAQDHLETALAHARLAVNGSVACTPNDADSDGLADADDNCPTAAEDFDGIADDDGCPDAELPKPKPTAEDRDGDGIADSRDSCPDEAEDLDGFNDLDGCPDEDNDGDRIVDVVDQCPLQAEDPDGFQDMDGCPDNDNDGDGYADIVDACPNDAGTGDGCPDRDADGDGFQDPVDKCPSEPENRNQYLDDDGCPDEKPADVKIAYNQIIIAQQIQFETGKARILTQSYPILDQVAVAMRDYATIEVRIEGHTDNVGNDDENNVLSKSRADSVFEYLVGQGIEASRMTTVGYGETRPVDTNRTPEGRQNNRRVEFHITKGLEETQP